MKKPFLFGFYLLLTISCFGQNKIDSLLQIGMQYHDNGEYNKAIDIYKQALKITPKSTLVNYEISLSYLYAGDNKNAIKHSDFVLKQNKDYLLPAYITKGSALDNLGKTEQSIKLFNEALKNNGDNYLLYYNIGIDYSKINDTKNAENAFIKAIQNNSSHNSSHYALALLESQNNNRVQSLLSLYYFLMLEPSSKRSETAYTLLKRQLGGNIQKDHDNPMNINVFLNPKNIESEFGPADTMIAMLEATNMLEENKNKTPEELFIDNTKSFFKVLGELFENDPKEKDNLWWKFYVPLFYKLAKSEYMDVFCYYISISSNDKANKWLDTNNEKLKAFAKWLQEQLKTNG